MNKQEIAKMVETYIGKDADVCTSATGNLVIEANWTTDALYYNYFVELFKRSHYGARIKYAGMNNQTYRVTFIFEAV